MLSNFFNFEENSDIEQPEKYIPVLLDKLRTARSTYILIMFALFISIGVYVITNHEGFDVFWWVAYLLVGSMLPFTMFAYLFFPSVGRVIHADHLIQYIQMNKPFMRDAPDDPESINEVEIYVNGVIREANVVITDRLNYRSFLLPVYALAFVSYIGFYVLFATAHPLFTFGELDELILEIPKAFIYGFSGGVLYALYSILNRYRSTDIPPALVFQLGYQIMLATIAAYFISTISPDYMDAFLAFAVGFIPYVELTEWIRAGAKNRLGTTLKFADEVSQEKALSSIDAFPGMSRRDAERLKEENIFTIQNLAFTNPVTLYLSTSFKMSRIIDWVNQAYLMVFLSPDQIKKLSHMGIRGAIGMQIKYQQTYGSEEHRNKLIKTICDAIGQDTNEVESLLERIENDIRVDFLTMMYKGYGSR